MLLKNVLPLKSALTNGKLVSSLLDLLFPFGGSEKNTLLSTILNAPLWTLAVAFAKCEVAAIPNCALSTFTTGRVAIPSATSVESLITPLAILENPTSVTFTYSSPILRKSLGATDPIPLSTNWDNPIPIFASNVCVIEVNVTGCWTTPS